MTDSNTQAGDGQEDEIAAAAAAAAGATPPADQPAPAPRKRQAKAELKGPDLVKQMLSRRDDGVVRLMAPGGRLGNALEPSIVYGPHVGTKRRIADIRANPWEQKQIAVGVLILESDEG